MKTVVSFLSIILVTFAMPSHSVESIEVNINPNWDSSYITEGQDNLDSGGLFSVDLGLSKDDFSFGLWLAKGSTESYQEINFYAEYGFSISDIEGYLGYTHILMPEEAHEEDQDNEIGFGLAYTAMQWVQPAIDYVWSSESNHSYAELSLSSDLIEGESQYQISPYALVSYDFGYVTEDYDGINHKQLGLEFSLALSEWHSLQLGLHHSRAGRNLKKDDKGNESWMNVGFSSEF